MTLRIAEAPSAPNQFISCNISWLEAEAEDMEALDLRLPLPDFMVENVGSMMVSLSRRFVPLHIFLGTAD